MRVAVVGAGLTGACTAFLLARSGADVLCIDSHDSPGRASDVNPGGLNPLHGPGIPGPLAGFALHCYQLHLQQWDEIRRLSALDFQGRIVSRLLLSFSSEELNALGVAERLYCDTAGFNAKALDPDDLADLRQGINPIALGGLLTTGNATVDSASYTLALLTAAQKWGARLVRDTVEGVVAKGNSLTGIRTAREVFPVEQAVFCTGPRSTLDLEGMQDEVFPVRAVKGELLIAELDARKYRHDVTWGPFGLYHAGGSRYWLGGTREECGLDASTTERAARLILEGIRTMMPSISSTALVDQQVGLRPMTPDGLPVLGRLRSLDNAYIANGGGLKGVLFSAGLADAIATLITENRETAESGLLCPYRFCATPDVDHG